MADLINLTAEDLGRKAQELTISGESDHLVELAQWVQRRALEVDGQAVVMRIIEAQESIDAEISQVVDENFWDLVATGMECGCQRCIKDKVDQYGVPLAMTRMVVCPTCGNKRCPHASNHELVCTYSNRSGQLGSIYK